MRFNIIIGTQEGLDKCRKEFEFEGTLDAAKTYVKLIEQKNFSWGAVLCLEEVPSGQVNRWMIRKNLTTGELDMRIFSFEDVDPMINVNAYMSSFAPKPGMDALNKVFGGGKF